MLNGIGKLLWSFLLSSLLIITVLPRLAIAGTDVRDSVVKIYSVRDQPDYENPWNMNGPESIYGSGCIIEGKRILTNAHIVGDATFIQVRLYGQPEKYTARLLAVSHEADLALMTVDDPAFFKGVEPLEFGELPRVQQDVLVYGFPLGGDTLSTTKGVVSRIEHQSYVHSSRNLLAIQLDAAINPGNSGGPVMVNGRICGVVMQNIPDLDNIGYTVPVPIINHFLTDMEDGKYDGFPEEGIIWQTIENEGLKRKYGLKKNQSGMLVTKILPGSSADGKLVRGDVIMSIDGHNVAGDGTTEFRPKERTSANYYIQHHQIGKSIDIKILRDSKIKTVRINLNQQMGSNNLVPTERYDVRPSYYIYGGLIFVPLTQDYLMTWGEKWIYEAPTNLLVLYEYDYPSVKGEEVVVLSKVLPSEANKGYHNLSDQRIKEVNGIKIIKLPDLVRAIETGSKDPFVVFKTNAGYEIVLDRKQADHDNSKILKIYNIPSDRSEDLM